MPGRTTPRPCDTCLGMGFVWTGSAHAICETCKSTGWPGRKRPRYIVAFYGGVTVKGSLWECPVNEADSPAEALMFALALKKSATAPDFMG